MAFPKTAHNGMKSSQHNTTIKNQVSLIIVCGPLLSEIFHPSTGTYTHTFIYEPIY